MNGLFTSETHLIEPESQDWGKGKRRPVAAPTFAREPPGLCAYADAPAVLVVLRGPAQVIPGTLGTDTTEVGAVRLDAFVNSLLLGKNQKASLPSAAP